MTRSGLLRGGRVAAWGAILALVLALAFVAGQTRVDAKHEDGHEPANKVAVSGSTLEVAGPDEEVVLLDTTMRNAAAKSLVLQVTLECSILTDLRTTGTDMARAESRLDVWVEVNGRAIGVSDGDEGFGEVTFCNREYQRETEFHGEDEDHVIDDFIRTKQTHAFNWVDLMTGNGIQEIVVKGRLSTDTAGTATAEVAVGNRTLVVEPVDTALGEDKSN